MSSSSALSVHRLAWVVFGCACLALVIGPLHPGDTRARPLHPGGTREATLGGGPFVRDGAAPDTDGHQRLDDLLTCGSYIPGTAAPGEHRTGWYEARPNFIVLVAGRPHHAGCSLTLERRDRDGRITSVPFDDRDPDGSWTPWYVSVPETTTAVRLRAVDRSPDADGWLAFSEPYKLKAPLSWQALAAGQLVATTCLALVLLHGPGLIWLADRRGAGAGAIVFALLQGPLLLLGLGLLVWAAGGSVDPKTCARVGAGALLGWIAWRFHAQSRRGFELPPALATVAAAAALLVGFGVAKANIAVGPPGELYGGLVSRTLEVGGHSDSRVPFHVVQVVAHHLAPFGPQASDYFAPWSFASRGPLAGIIAAPVVLATGADVPTGMPDQPWRPFDREGFAAYRSTLIALAALAAWAIYAVLLQAGGPAWGLVGAAAALLAPFFVHEMYFTWPKLVAAGLVLGAFVLAQERRFAAAGLVLGIGYLFHPLPILSTPFLGSWIVARTWGTGWRATVTSLLAFAVAVAAMVAAWQAAGALAPAHRGNQLGFIAYFQLADNAPATVSSWWASRWQNLANTFLPLHLLWFDPGHESLNSVYARSPAWVRADFLYWNTLPFALGAPLFLLSGYALAAALRRHAAVACTLVLGPALLLVVYWGAADSGLMRHCGQVLFLSVIALSVWTLRARSGGWAEPVVRAFLHPLTFAWRGLEIAVMAFGTTVLNGFPHLSGPFAATDIGSFAVALCLLGAAIILLAKAGRAHISDLFNHASLSCPRPSSSPVPPA